MINFIRPILVSLCLMDVLPDLLVILILLWFVNGFMFHSCLFISRFSLCIYVPASIRFLSGLLFSSCMQFLSPQVKCCQIFIISSRKTSITIGAQSHCELWPLVIEGSPLASCEDEGWMWEDWEKGQHTLEKLNELLGVWAQLAGAGAWGCGSCAA